VTAASRIIAVDVVGSRLALARELGATDVIDAKRAVFSTMRRSPANAAIAFASL